MNRETLAWAAGLFEGEGCISHYHPLGHDYIQSSLQMNDEDRVRLFHEAIGGLGAVYHEAPKLDKVPPRRHDTWRWASGKFEHVQAVIAMLWPWLGPRRRARAAELLKGWR